MHSFQYKVVHRIIPCNQFLANIRLKPDDTCSFCNDRDTVQHFLLDCENTNNFWNSVRRWMEQEANLEIRISPQEYLLGVSPTIPGAWKINYITMFVKFFVHRQKLFHNGELPLTLFLRELRVKLQIEKHICFLENKPDKFRPWNGVLGALG